MPLSCSDLFLALLSILFPPLGVWIKRGLCSADSLLNILLCCLGYLPGLLHSWYIIARYPEEYEPLNMQDEEAARRIAGAGGRGNDGGRVTYVYVSRQEGMGVHGAGASAGVGAPDGGKARLQIQRGASYGAVSGSGSGNAQAQVHGQTGSSGRPQQSSSQQQTRDDGGAAQSQNPPPTYAEAIKGDNKIQK